MQFRTIPQGAYPQSPVWEKAAKSTNQADPFCCTPTWQLCFHDAFSPDRRLLIEESSSSIITFAEKIFTPENIFLTPVEPHWLFGCPLLGKDAVDLLAGCMGFFEETYKPFFPKFIISGIRPNGELSRRLIKKFAKYFKAYLYASGVQCAASLSGGVDGFLSRRSANHRSKLKKAAKRANGQGVYFERVTPASPVEAGRVYTRMLAVEESSWKGLGQCGMSEPPAKHFYDLMIRRLSNFQRARIIFARHEDKDIGFIFGAMAGNIYRGQQFSYNNEWKNFSIGNLLQLEKVKWLCEEGVKRYDMGPLDGPRMEYKEHWTEKTLPIQTWILVKA